MKTDIYTLAHEIKNPLCVANGYLEMMNEENFQKYKEIIKAEIKTSLEILDNYLEMNKLKVNMEEIDLNVLLLELRKSMKDYLLQKGVNLTIKLVDDEIYLMADFNKLKQVFYNIIKNSIEAHSKNITIYYDIIFDKIKIKIENDGDKINNDIFYRIGNNYSSKVLGNGIGMTLSKEIIEMHNGKIKCQNNLKKGISTIITLNLN